MIAQFALRLVCGMSLVWLILPRDRITPGFFRIQMLVALGLSALAALTMGNFTVAGSPTDSLLTASNGRLGCLFLIGLAFLGSVVWTLGRRRAGLLCILGIAALSAGVLLLSSVSKPALETTIGGLTLFSELSTSLLIGSATTSMLLGHWYLTAPTMSIDPLYRANACFAGGAVLRLLASSGGLAVGWSSMAAGTPTLWLVLRWIAGIVAPLVLAGMVWRILKYRNTQAATGVLFVGVIVTFIGELSATLVSREVHIPF
jgi:hypothetical protein